MKNMVVETEVREREREVEVEEIDGGLDGGGFRRRKRIQNEKKKKMRSLFCCWGCFSLEIEESEKYSSVEGL